MEYIPKDIFEQVGKIVLGSLEQAQKNKNPEMKEPVYQVDITSLAFKQIKTDLPPFIAQNPIILLVMHYQISNLLLTDKYYIDKDQTVYSVTRLEGMKLWSEWMIHNFPGYKFVAEQDHKLIPDTVPTLSYEELKKMLLSKDLTPEQKKEFDEKIETHDSLLFNGDQKVPTVGLSTFPRSGNSLTRKYFESITGTATGSSMSIEAPVSLAFMPMGFKAERYYDDHIWMFKTHIPMCEGLNVTDKKSYNMAKALVVVRNPLDTSQSLAHLQTTCTHTLSIIPNIFSDFGEEMGNYFLQQCIDIYSTANKFWMRVAQEKKLPVFFMRFEDITTNPVPSLKAFFEFLLEVENIEGTYLMERIIEAANPDRKASVLYKPRQGGIYKNTHLYSAEQIEKIGKECKDQLLYFGYGKIKGQETDEKYAFFEYDQSEVGDIKIGGFREENQIQKEWCLKDPETTNKITNVKDVMTELGNDGRYFDPKCYIEGMKFIDEFKIRPPTTQQQ